VFEDAPSGVEAAKAAGMHVGTYGARVTTVLYVSLDFCITILKTKTSQMVVA
jgi:beta-phosphoglucomutase-like phosphatase (HAD superfamily)